ncbi:class I SAM-dependent methyltransferase [Stackebrandtia nassauensis]|uniref:Phospholipid N-methyltransferase n=1 Tax=Stackebrandtia nassauensis (strain DSM 44728 / CIP 108903 / NRRL B-16338 / NBRC 102104 / LLR-40K-21) TaxID=446470 RepID=D3QBA4_STANL|nr:methyltransferase domain-containing protein [Stackebrandtia nassauensis]ADD40921.1 phospholipid N-methyltransferase [Stackebrandtia nassauensis DSM 44728]
MTHEPGTPKPPSYLRDVGVFFRHWLKAPGKTGAVWPSSRFLARSLASALDGYSQPAVAELGPGTGPATAQIQARLAGAGTHVAVDLNPQFASMLAARFPDVDVVCDSADRLPAILAERDITVVDAVVSGLPFAAFPAGLQRDILDAVVASLHPGHGVFTTFNYVGAFSLPPARRFRGLLAERFEEISISGPVLRNIPPAYVLTARKPRA